MKDNIKKNPVPSFEKRRVLRQSGSLEAVCMDDFLHLFSFLGFDDSVYDFWRLAYGWLHI